MDLMDWMDDDEEVTGGRKMASTPVTRRKAKDLAKVSQQKRKRLSSNSSSRTRVSLPTPKRDLEFDEDCESMLQLTPKPDKENRNGSRTRMVRNESSAKKHKTLPTTTTIEMSPIKRPSSSMKKQSACDSFADSGYLDAEESPLFDGDGKGDIMKTPKVPRKPRAASSASRPRTQQRKSKAKSKPVGDLWDRAIAKNPGLGDYIESFNKTMDEINEHEMSMHSS